MEAAQLAVAPDQRRGEPRAAVPRRDVDLDEPEGEYALRLALELQRRECLHADRMPDELEGVLADEDLAPRRRLLEAGGNVDGVTTDGAMATRELAGDHLAGVHASA
jgi:hypothetical protein